MSPPQPKQVTEMEKGNYRYIERVYQKLLREKPDLENNIDTFLNRDIEVREVRMVITNLARSKAIGPDLVHNRFLKFLTYNSCREITKVFNQCLREGVHPSIWNCCNINPIPKPGKDHSLPKNHRPIAISSCLGRILEKIIASRLQTYCIVNEIFVNNQCGFQISRSTHDVLTVLLEDVTTNQMNMTQDT